MNTIASGNQYYVSANGSPANDGTISSPWSLSYACSGARKGNILRIQPGDTVWVRGGTYRSETGLGFKITVSGSATDKITFKQYPGETIVLDGAIPEFTVVGNNAWEPHGALAPGHHVYRSHNTFPVHNVFYGGFIQIGPEWFSLAPHRTPDYLLSDTHVWDPPRPRYLGPGISQSPEGYLFVRLDNSTPQAQLGRPVPQISDADPGHHALYLCSSRSFGFTITGSHLVIEDFAQIDYFGGCFYMGTPGQTDITLRHCGGRPIYFGARCGSVEGLTLDSCKFYAHMPSHKWWVAYADIKGDDTPADHVRKLGLDLGAATDVAVINCVFDEFFDGILASAAHDIEIHHTTFNHIWDDAWQMMGNLYHINFHHNFCYGAGPSVDGSGTKEANTDPGTVYVHHNVIDTTTRLVFWGRSCSPGSGMGESIPLSSHGSPIVYTWPRKLYYNTIVTRQSFGTHFYVGWNLFGATATNSQAKHEVYNNIFEVIDGRPGGRDFDATTEREIYDGNVYWYYPDLPALASSPWQLLHMSDGSGGTQIVKSLTDVTQLRASRAFTDSQSYYPPGWERSGLSVDPQLDHTYKPQNPSCQTGAVNLTAKGWPGTEIYESWRGAIRP